MMSHNFLEIKRISLCACMEQVSLKEFKASKEKKLKYGKKNIPNFCGVSYDI